MEDSGRTDRDLDYVRAVVARAEQGSSPASIYFLWAIVSFFGYAIIDFSPETTGFYWMIAGPLGGVVSGLLGRAHSRRRGQISERRDVGQLILWSGLIAAILLLIPLVSTGRVRSADLPRVILVLVSFAYWSAGVWLDRRMLAVGAATAGLYLFSVYAADLPWVWTITGLGLAVSLGAAGSLAAARRPRASDASA